MRVRSSIEKYDVKMKGLYIAFEGIDGSGKTYHSERIANKLKELGYDIVYVREPWNDNLKNFLYSYNLEPDVETYVFAVDRIMLHKEIVTKALSEGKIVISDRSVYASMAYQSAKGVPLEFILLVNRVIKLPDVVFLLDLPVEVALERIKNRQRTRFEEKEYLKRVREIYLKLPTIFKNTTFIIIDASKSIAEVEKEIQKYLVSILCGS